MKPVVFLGPSLPRAEAKALLPEADIRPPAGQGDIYRAAQDGVPAIGLLAGIFKDAPTVRHRAIMWALAQGIPVYGASSMGALRAAEIPEMIGVGLIYRWYRRFALLPDDAVAVTHTPRELGAQPLSDALVDIRRNLARAARSGELPADIANEEAMRLTALPFADRRSPKAARRDSQKARDAEALLRRMAHDAANGWPAVTVPQPPIVHAWLDDLRDGGCPPPHTT